MVSRTLLALALLVAMNSWGGEICRAIDGDTLRCGQERVRLKAVYAAELSERGGPEARLQLQRRIDAGDVRIQRQGRDRYGRTLGTVYVNGRPLDQSDIGPRAGRGARPRF